MGGIYCCACCVTLPPSLTCKAKCDFLEEEKTALKAQAQSNMCANMYCKYVLMCAPVYVMICVENCFGSECA